MGCAAINCCSKWSGSIAPTKAPDDGLYGSDFEKVGRIIGENRLNSCLTSSRQLGLQLQLHTLLLRYISTLCLMRGQEGSETILVKGKDTLHSRSSSPYITQIPHLVTCPTPPGTRDWPLAVAVVV